jgi:hypothetical protein
MNIETNSPTNLEEQICESINELEEYVEEEKIIYGKEEELANKRR